MTVDMISPVIDDIEDSLPGPLEQRPVRSSKQSFVTGLLHNEEVPEEAKRSVPGVQTVYVRTFGCSHNQSDSEYMMGILQAYGYRCYSTGHPQSQTVSPELHAWCTVITLI
jgi:hypothetical protein